MSNKLISVQITDQELLAQYLKGSVSALQAIIHRHKKKIYSSIYLLVKDKEIADDVFQDTFVKIIDTLHSGKYNEEGKFLPWALRIAHNLCIDHFRRIAKMPFVSAEDGGDVFDFISLVEDNVEDKLVRHQTHEKVRSMIAYLPLEQREVLIMRHYNELSFKEISDITGVSINTALGRMRYALNNLRKMMEKKSISF